MGWGGFSAEQCLGLNLLIRAFVLNALIRFDRRSQACSEQACQTRAPLRSGLTHTRDRDRHIMIRESRPAHIRRRNRLGFARAFVLRAFVLVQGYRDCGTNKRTHLDPVFPVVNGDSDSSPEAAVPAGPGPARGGGAAVSHRSSRASEHAKEKGSKGRGGGAGADLRPPPPLYWTGAGGVCRHRRLGRRCPRRQ